MYGEGGGRGCAMKEPVKSLYLIVVWFINQNQTKDNVFSQRCILPLLERVYTAHHSQRPPSPLPLLLIGMLSVQENRHLIQVPNVQDLVKVSLLAWLAVKRPRELYDKKV